MEVVKIVHAEEESNGVEPRRDESNGNGAHDGDRNHFLGAVDFLGEVSRTIETSKGIISVDQANDECDPIRRPPSIVHKVSKDKLGILMRWRLRRDCDQDNKERYQRCEYRYLGYDG